MNNFFLEILRKKKDFTKFDLNLAFICSRLCFVSYLNPKGQNSFLINSGFRNIKIIRNQNAHAILAMYKEEIYIVIRGTVFTNKKDIRDDFDLIWAKEKIGEVHAGYQKHLNLLWPEILTYLSGKEYKELIFTGHSLGGACGQIANYRIPKSIGYHFGSPRCVDKIVRKRNHSLVFDIQHQFDIVPGLPPRIFGFKMLGTSLIIKNSIIKKKTNLLDLLHSVFCTLIYFLVRLFGHKSRFVDMVLLNHKIYDYVLNLKKLLKNS